MRLAVPVALLVAALYALPLLGFSEYIMTVAVVACVFAVLSGGLNLVYGYGGLLSLAQVTFWGVGAYTSGLLAQDLKWNPWLTLPVAGLTAAIAGVFVAYASLRLSRHSFAIVSLVFALLMQLVARDWVSLTRGALGMPGLPPLVIGGYAFDSATKFFWPMLTYTVLALALLYRLMHSRIGQMLLAIRQNEPLAQSHGIDPLAHRLLAIGVSAMLSGIAGGMFVFQLTIVDPSIMDFYYTEAMLIMVIVGGPGSFWGVLAASAVFTVMPEALRLSPELRMVLYGAVLVAAMLVMPAGIGGLLAQRREKKWRTRFA
ncbi:MAG: branched-chain amino acid ABC transporter permease [Alphaproteobacteria bacterium]|nr:branched-chain amino acid ABC transporter permease [Alphaproteobacteria bacterium]